MIARKVTGDDLARAARELVGVRFCLHGRDTEQGLDCVGVVAQALSRCGLAPRFPNGYALRRKEPPKLDTLFLALGLHATPPTNRTGAITLLRSGPGQYHFAICTSPSGLAVHAHAGLRRVVEAPLPDHWPCLGQWHFASSPT